MKVLEFQRKLLGWYDANARDLPWRRTDDPFSIWISEIMLQQTRVAAVLQHYARFLRLFPSVTALAAAREEEVLAAWSGLGYYRRATQLHRAARVVVQDCGGSLPQAAKELRKLPGIGEYTSAAIASIAFGERIAVVDGNVERVVLRVLPPTKESTMTRSTWIREHAATLLDAGRPGDFNQSMMELGATICLPKNPTCLICPVRPFCATRGEHRERPGKRMHSRQIAYALLCRNDSTGRQILLDRRSQSASLMPGMWELPEVAVQPEDSERVEMLLRHSITVTSYHVSVLRFSEKQGNQRLPPAKDRRKWIKSSEVGKLPLTGLARKILMRLQILPAGQP